MSQTIEVAMSCSIEVVVESLVVQGEKHGHAAAHPVVRVDDGGQLAVEDEVGGVARGGQHAAPFRGSVERAHVAAVVALLRHGGGHQPELGRVGEEDLFERFLDNHLVVVPASAVHEHAVNVAAILGFLAEIGGFSQGVELKTHRVDGDAVLACEVLQHSSEEGVREEEATDPELHGRAIVHPVLEHFQSCYEIVEVAAQRHHGREAHRRPQHWHLLVKEVDGQRLDRR